MTDAMTSAMFMYLLIIITEISSTSIAMLAIKPQAYANMRVENRNAQRS